MRRLGHPNFELVHHDVVEPYMIEVDEIFHLASPASPPHYMFNPIKTIKTNTIGTINLLGLAKRVGARLLLASTSEVYGNPEVHPQVETYFGNVNPIGPRACYDEGKRIAETMCYAYQKQEGVDVRVIRIFNTFGPRMHIGDGRVVSNFIIQALQGQDLTVYGDGQQTRSFQYVSDLVAGMIALMNGNYSQVRTPHLLRSHAVCLSEMRRLALLASSMFPESKARISRAALVVFGFLSLSSLGAVPAPASQYRQSRRVHNVGVRKVYSAGSRCVPPCNH